MTTREILRILHLILTLWFHGRDIIHSFIHSFNSFSQRPHIVKQSIYKYCYGWIWRAYRYDVVICTAGPPMTMTEMAKESLEGQRIRFENDREVPFNLGPDHGSTTRFGVLEVVDTYDEKYLLAHSLMCNESDGRLVQLLIIIMFLFYFAGWG